MFGGGNTFGSTNTGGFGTAPAFGAAPNTSVFGGTGTTFGAQQNKPAFGSSTFGSTAGGGGLFGSNTGTTGGGLFGSTNTAATSTFGTSNTAFGQPSTSFGGFGQTTQQQNTGGLFGSTTTSQSGGLFGSQPAGQSTFGSTGGTFGSTGGTFGGFGGGQQQAGTGHVKFNPLSGTDTMMKSGIQTNINTRHQCISCMKEYENKSMEELRFEDYGAGRRGTAGGGGGGGLFGSNQQQPAAGGVLFGSQPASTSGMFGQQQNKPLFGTSGGFGATTSAAPAFGSTAPTSTGFGGGGGLFGAKPFQATTSTTGFGGFGQQQQQTGGLFGQQQQQNKPFGAAAPQPQAGGGLFGSANTGTTGFGGTTSTFGGFGQQQNQQQQNIGLFGANQNQAKPTFGFSSQPASSGTTFGGFGSTTGTQAGGLFGQQQQNKPAFGGFGTATTQASTGFGGFGATSSTGGGLFGSNQAKPAFSFGGTSTASSGFGGFGTNTSGTGLFSGASKPGGLFGTTGTGFGTGTGGFGTAGTTGFGGTGTTSAFGTGGLNFGGAGAFGGAGGAGAQAGAPGSAAPAPSSAVQQQLLLALASSPFGDNPLFKTVGETGKRGEVLKGEGGGAAPSSAGKGLALSQYKVAPHRNIKVKTKPVDSVNKSSMFEGLDDDLPGEGDMFVPRSSIKKLVLRNKKGDSTNSPAVTSTGGDDPSQETSLTVPLDESRLIVKKVVAVPTLNNDRRVDLDADDSFTALNTRKKNGSDNGVPGSDEEGGGDKGDKNEGSGGEGNQSGFGDSDKENEGGKHPNGITLQRNGYYTIPPLQEIEADSEGKCLVEGFTIGREGYGNVHYPGTTDITGLNLDEIVFFRHKEVIVYPEDENKPPLGEGLNKKAQITLDKVWPTDKQDSSLIKSPDRIKTINFEDKLIRASSRLGARFIEYRPETGSWVFKVDHFSKYGLDDSDEEDVPLDNNKKMKTLQLEKRTGDKRTGMLDSVTLTNQPLGGLMEGRQPLSTLDNQRMVEQTESDGGGKGSSDGEEERDIEMNDVSNIMKQQTTLLRSALFSETVEEGEMTDFPAPKPVILQQRNMNVTDMTRSRLLASNNTSSNQDTLLRSRFLEDPVSSTRIGGAKGLGGSMITDSLNTTSLLRSHYSIQTTSQEPDTGTKSKESMLKISSKLPSYSLTSGYDKFTQLQNSVIQDDPVTVTPQYVDTEVPLESSFLRKRFQQCADAGLFHNKRFRVGFGGGGGWRHVETPGGGYLNLVELDNSSLQDWQLESLEAWLQVALDNSNLEITEEGPHVSPIQSVDTLQQHYLEATTQLDNCQDSEERRVKLWEVKHTWSLLMALWNTLESQKQDEDGHVGVEGHEETMLRREHFSAWLQEGVHSQAQAALRRARENNDELAKVHAHLDGGDVEGACDALQEARDHRAALLVAQMGSGPSSSTSRLVQHQINRWRECEADRHISQPRLRLLSMVAGQPVQEVNQQVNTVAGLDWQRVVAHQLWYLSSPVASVPDTLATYDSAWKSGDPYCARPEPSYEEDSEGTLEDGGGSPVDLKYHIIKLYSDRSHSLENSLIPATHTSDPLDFRTSWFMYRILESLGYKMTSTSSKEKLCKEFSSQLEKLGLWHWAVFVLLHINDAVSRQRSVESLLERSVALEDPEAKETWILETLGVPEPWLARAKSVLARVQGDHLELANQLLKAEDWKEAHTVIVQELAPAAILAQEYQLLKQLLEQLAREEAIKQQIPGWDTEGQIYLEFLSVGAAVDRVLQGNRESDPNMLRYEFERLKPVVTNLCRKIGNLVVNTSKQRLAQSEIAKQAAHYMRAVFSFEALADSISGTGSSARQLAESLSALALPEDYALQELRNLTRSYLSEIMES